MKYLLLGLSILLMSAAFSQEIDSAAADTTNTFKLFNGIALSYDYGKLITSFSEFETKFEVTGHLSLLRFQHQNFYEAIQFSGELGTGTLNPNNAYKNTDYEVDGNYYRVGIDYLRTIDAKNNISLGFRYGASTYGDNGIVQIESESNLFGDYSRSFSRTGLKANWWEVILITEGKFFRIYNPETDRKLFAILDDIYLGANIRFRVLIDYDRIDPDIDPVDTYAIPGYGRTFSKSVPAFNLFIKYRIDFK